MTHTFLYRNIFCSTIILVFFVCTLVYSEQEITLKNHDLSVIDSRIHEKIEEAGLLVNDEKMLNYLNTLLSKLYDPAKLNGRVSHVKVLNSSELNAFSFSNGTIYINLPILGLIENEAQLALLLSHEIAHIEQNHHMALKYELHEQALQAAQSQIVGSMFGINISANRTIRVALCGFSKVQEYEADSIALNNLISKGYNVWKAKDLFLIMNTWLNSTGKNLDTTFATHPQFLDRFEKSKEILFSTKADTTSGIEGGSTYRTLIQPFYGKITDLLTASNSISELYSLSLRMISLNENFPEGYYLRGKILEKYNPVDSFTIAKEAFDRSVSLDPKFSKSFREIGWLYLKKSQYDSAYVYLKKYLMENPSATDTAIIRFYLGKKL